MVYDGTRKILRHRHEILHFDITKILQYRQNYQNCSNLNNDAIFLLLTRALLGLWIFHRLLGGGGGGAFERPPP